MSVPSQQAPGPFGPAPFDHGPGRTMPWSGMPIPPPRRDPVDRTRAIIAVCVIVCVGGTGAMMSVVMGAFAGDGCTSLSDPRFQCNGLGAFFFCLASPIAVAVAAALATVGIVGRARGGHVWSTLAWCVWGGFCLFWWAVVLTL